MVLDPLDLFRLGQTLANNLSDEASQRTAIGRAYYSCHLIARDQLYGTDGQRRLTPRERARLAGNKNAGDHLVVIRAVATNRNFHRGRAKRLSDQLGELRDMRVQADYYRDPTNQGTTSLFQKYSVANWPGLASAAMTLASNLLPELQQLRP